MIRRERRQRRERRLMNFNYKDIVTEQYNKVGLLVIKGIRKVEKAIEKKRRK